MLCVAAMPDDRLILAIGRLERALSRIEGQGAAPVSDKGEAEAFIRLDARHRRLRTRTEGAIERIDRLLQTPAES